MDSSGQRLSPTRTVVTSFSPRKPSTTASSIFEEGDWVLCLAVNTSSRNGATTTTTPPTSGSTISCALSNGIVQVYDAQRLHIIASFTPGQQQSNHDHHANMITDMIYYNDDDTALLTTHQDGSVVVTDLRQSQQPALHTRIPRSSTSSSSSSTVVESALCVDLGLDGNIAAVGSNRASIHFFDVRYGARAGDLNNNNNNSNKNDNQRLLGSYTNAHTDAVTKVQFHPQQRSTLCSGGEDGLLCCFDTTQSTEELALQTVMNVGAPCRQLGFCAGAPAGISDSSTSSSNTLYCLTGNETVSLWDMDTATCLQNFGGTSLRDALTQQTTLQPPSSSAASSSVPSVPIQYLVDAHWDAARRELLLCAGNSDGDAALFACRDGMSWNLQHTLVGGHRGVVRAWKPVSTLTSGILTGTTATMGSPVMLVTVGEDARLCEWNRLGPALALQQQHQQQQRRLSGTDSATATTALPNAAVVPTVAAKPGGGPMRRQRRHSHKSLAAPY